MIINCHCGKIRYNNMLLRTSVVYDSYSRKYHEETRVKITYPKHNLKHDSYSIKIYWQFV